MKLLIASLLCLALNGFAIENSDDNCQKELERTGCQPCYKICREKTNHSEGNTKTNIKNEKRPASGNQATSAKKV